MRETARSRIICILICTCSLVTISANAESPGFHLRKTCKELVAGGSVYRLRYPAYDGTSIRLHDTEDGTVEDFMTVEDPFEEVQLSLSCKWIAYRKYDREIKKSTVRLVSRTGKGTHTLLDVRRYAWVSWGDDGDSIAYIVSTDNDTEGFQSYGTWLLNMRTGEKRQIHPRGHEVAWSDFDQSLYVRDWYYTGEPDTSVQRYNFKTNEIENTSYQGIDFSPDGKYYHTRSYGEGLFRVFQRTENKDITTRYSEMLERYFNGDPNFWLNNSMIVFRSYRPMKTKNRIIDFDRGEAWEVDEEVVGFADDEEKILLLLVDDKVVKRSFEEAATLIYPEPQEEKATQEDSVDEEEEEGVGGE